MLILYLTFQEYDNINSWCMMHDADNAWWPCKHQQLETNKMKHLQSFFCHFIEEFYDFCAPNLKK